MKVKLFFIFLFLFLSLFHAHTFYHYSTNYKITTGLDFSNDFTIAASEEDGVLKGDPSNLQDGDIICPMEVEITPEFSGEWGDSFTAYSSYLKDVPLPENYNKVKSYSVKFLTKGDFDDVLDANKEDNDDTFDEFIDPSPVMSYLSSWHTQPVFFKPTGSGSFLTEQKKGSANIYCGGQYSVDATNFNTKSVDLASSDSVMLNLQSTGTYTIVGSFDGAKCFGAIKVTDPLYGTDYMFLYTKDSSLKQKSYSIPVTELSIEINVIQPTIDLNLVPGSLKDIDGNSPPFEFPGIVEVTMSVTNDGDLPVKFNGENTITSGFLVPDINSDGKWDLFDVNGYIDYNTFTIDHDKTKKIRFTIMYPGDDLPNNLNKIHIELGYESEGKDPCTGKTLSPKSLPIDISIKEKAIIPKKYNCSIEPSSKLDMVVDKSFSPFIVTCKEDGISTPCSNVEWSITNGWKVTPSMIITKSTVTPKSAGSSKLTADVVINNVGASCSANLKATEPPPLTTDYNCTITPSSKLDMVLETDYYFNLACYFKKQLTECDQTDWSITPNTWELFNPALTKAIITPNTLNNGKLTADVVIDGIDASCSANLKANSTGEIPPVTTDYSCAITPSSKLDMVLETDYDFDLTCYFKEQPTNCDQIDWSLTINTWGLSNPIPTKATVTPITLDKGKLTADVVIDGIDATCSAHVRANSTPIITTDYSCMITPPEKLDMAIGKNYDFTLACFFKKQPKNCHGVEWSLTPSLQAWDLTTYADPLKSKVTPSSITSGKLTADVVIDNVDSSCSANLRSVSNYTAEIDPSENLDMTINVSYPFTLICKNWGKQIQCGQVSWTLHPAGWKLDKFPAPFPLVFVTPLSTGSRMLSVVVTYPDGSASDSAPLEAAVVDSCVLNMKTIGLGGIEFDFDPNDGLPENTQFKTYITCTESGAEVPCNNVHWFIDGGSKSGSTNEYLSGSSGGAEVDILSIVANAQVSSGQLICSVLTDIIHPTSCEISEEFFVDGFDDFKFVVKCFEGKEEVDCGEIGGKPDYDINLYSGDLQLLLDTHYTEEPDHISVTNAPDEYWLFVEILNYLINYPDGVEYDLTVTIPAVGAERPTECEADGEMGNLLCEFFI